MMKKVVVTGIGLVSCLGNNQEEVYKSLINPFLNSPTSFFISVILSNINIGGKGNFALPSPNNSPLPQEIKSS